MLSDGIQRRALLKYRYIIPQMYTKHTAYRVYSQTRSNFVTMTSSITILLADVNILWVLAAHALRTDVLFGSLLFYRHVIHTCYFFICLI